MSKAIRQNLAKKDVLTAAEFREMQADGDRANGKKFGNKWVLIDGHFFQSQKEANYYGGLKMRKLAKAIRGFEMQKTFPFVVNGVLICSYRCDFVIENNDGTKTVVDVKSDWTANLKEFKIKKALMLALYNIEILIAK